MPLRGSGVEVKVLESEVLYSVSSTSNDTSETNAQWFSKRVLNSQFFPTRKEKRILSEKDNRRQRLELYSKIKNF